MTARQLWRPPVGIPTRVIQVPWGRRLCEIELVCIKLGESITSWAEKVPSKNLPLAPLAPPPKLDGTRPSFAVGGTFEKSILPPFCPLRPR